MAVRSPQLVSDTIFWQVTQKGIEGLIVYCINQLVFNLVGIVTISAKPHYELGTLHPPLVERKRWIKLVKQISLLTGLYQNFVELIYVC